MTVAPIEPGTPGSDLANPADFDSDNLGLEDIGVGDVVIPRLKIIHDEAVFEDNLSHSKFSTLEVIMLGLVKQRIMWDKQIDENDRPQCKSPDFEHGFPQMRTDIPATKQFPWAKSNFNKEAYPPENGINGLQTLPCASCIFSQWDKGDWKNPPCNEQHTFPLLYSPDGETWQPALFTLQKSGIKPSRQYISYFANAKVPMFTVITQLSLTPQKRGANEFAVPTFKRVRESERSAWQEYANQYRSIREFIRQAPRPLEDDDDGTPAGTTANANTGPAPAGDDPWATPAEAAPTAPPATAAPTPAPAPPAPPVEQAAPVAAAPAPAAPAPVAPAPPAPAPAATTQPAPATPAPAAPAPVVTPEPAPAAPAAPAATVPEDLPF